MATKCPECSSKFTLKEALCYDWKDPEKSYGCPHCGTFFINDISYKPSNLISGIGVGCVFVPATMMLGRGLFTEGGDMLVAIQAGIIILSCIAITVLNSPPSSFFSPLKKSPYNKANQQGPSAGTR